MKNYGTILIFLFFVASAFGNDVAENRPNILLVITDQQFADAMSCRMGTQYIHTPNMDTLAKTGLLFTRAYAPNPLCMPARASIMTGRYPHETEIQYNQPKPWNVAGAKFPGMGTWFRQVGYETAYFGKWHLVYGQNDVDMHGFERVLWPKSEEKSGEGEKGYDSGISDLVLKFLDKKHDKPFLAVVSYLNPHNICEYPRGESLPCGPIGEPPAKEFWPPAPANLDLPKNESDAMLAVLKGYRANPMFPVGNHTAEDWRKHRWAYYRMIEKVDTELGKLLESLRKNKCDDNTVIVFTSDHGECAGAHRFNQKTVFYEESARVPLIIRTPGGRSMVDDRLVNIGLDILPTLLACAGIPTPKPLTGLSLKTTSSSKEWRDEIILENQMDQTYPVDGERVSIHGRAVRTNQYKYCLYSEGQQRESLFNLQDDPGETVNLATNSAYRDVLLEHRARLERFAKKQQDVLAQKMLENDVAPVPFTNVSFSNPAKTLKNEASLKSIP